jgi:hypothetical protein
MRCRTGCFVRTDLRAVRARQQRGGASRAGACLSCSRGIFGYQSGSIRGRLKADIVIRIGSASLNLISLRFLEPSNLVATHHMALTMIAPAVFNRAKALILEDITRERHAYPLFHNWERW